MADTPNTPALFSQAWYEASITAQQQEVEKAYAFWQQNLGALALLQGQLALVKQQDAQTAEAKEGTDGRNDAS